MKSAFTAHPLHDLTVEALQRRLDSRYAGHQLQNVLNTSRALHGGHGEESDDILGFQPAESINRAGAQGLPLSQNPQFPQNPVGLSRSGVLEKAGRGSLRHGWNLQVTLQAGRIFSHRPLYPAGAAGTWPALRLADVSPPRRIA